MTGLIVDTEPSSSTVSHAFISVGSPAPPAAPIAAAITSPTAGATLTQGTPVTITGTISAAGTVVVKLGSTTLGSATMAGLNWSYSWTPLAGDVGNQTLGATATATAGGSTGDAPGVAITVASSSIAAAITSPTAGATVTQGTPVTITGTISAPGTVVVKLGSTTLGSATMAGLNWSYSWTPQAGDVGAQTLNATATATFGGVTGNAPGIAISVAASSITVAITSPTAGASVAQGTSTTITGTISVAGTVVVKQGSTVLGSATMAGLNWSFSWTPQLADIGAQTLNATATATIGGVTGNATGVAVTVFFSPAQLSSLAFWLDGTQSTFSDAGSSTPATAPLGRVARIPQPAPLTGSWASPELTTSRPYRDAAGLCFEPLAAGSYSGQNISPPAGATLPANDNTLAIHFVSRVSETVTLNSWYALFRGQDASNGFRYGLSVNTGKLAYYANNTLRNTTTVVPLGAQVSVVARWTATGWDAKVSINGVASTFTFSVALPAGTINTLIAGLIDTAVAGNPPHCSISQAFGVGRAVTDAERDAMITWLDAKPADAAFPVSANFVAVSGDSIAASQGLVTESPGFVWGMLPGLQAVGPQIKVLNGGMPADKISNAQTRYNGTIKPIYSASRTKNILLIQVGTNSLALGGGTVASYIAAIYALADGARTDGFKVILCTLLPRSDAGISATFNADRATYNTDIRANWASHADALCDFATITGLGADADSTGANYQADHVHPNAAGHALMRPVAEAAVVSLL